MARADLVTEVRKVCRECAGRTPEIETLRISVHLRPTGPRRGIAMRNVRPVGLHDQKRAAQKRATLLSGRVAHLAGLAPDVIEVCVALDQEADYRPGQYYEVQFRGFPARYFCATVPLDRFGQHDSIHFHIRRIQGGRVSSALMQGISAGHRVTMKGAFGSAYLRAGMAGRLVLFAGSTGFAPIWAIADAAMREDYERELVLVVSARAIESLYMIPALWRLAGCPNVTIIPVTDAPQSVSSIIRTGVGTDFIPELRQEDIVYAAGTPALVGAVETMAEAAGVLCYAEAFTASPQTEHGLVSRAISWLSRGITAEAPVHRRANAAREASPASRPVRPRRLHAKDMPADAHG